MPEEERITSGDQLNTDGVLALVEAFVKDLARDYADALRKRNKGRIQECEDIFRSEYFYGLTEIDGQALIEKIRKGVSEYG